MYVFVHRRFTYGKMMVDTEDLHNIDLFSGQGAMNAALSGKLIL